MTRKFTLTAMVAAAVFFCSSWLYAGTEDVKKQLENADQDGRISYAIGYDVTRNLKNSFTIDTDLFLQGMKDSLAGESSMTEAEIKETIEAFQNMAREKQVEAMAKKADENKAKGAAFLSENKSKEGVVQLDSGLQYKVIKEGDGPSPKAEDKVKCHYTGTLIDGTKFDSSHDRDQPAVFPVNGVIKGWTQALQKMKVGGKWMLYLPSDLAYGDRGAGDAIEPGETLIFEVELLSIEE